MGRVFVALIVPCLLAFLATPTLAQMPPEWPGAARAVLAELEKGSTLAERPFKDEARQGWTLARKWRLHNNRNTEIVMAEYLAMVTLCRWSGCTKDTVAGKSIPARAADVKAEKKRFADAYAMVDASFAWLNELAGPGTESAKKNAALWAKDKDISAADFAVSNIYALGWLLAREQPDAARQAAMMSYFGLYVNEKAWIGERCLDISKIATILDAPPKVESCN
ncbi:MAG TPA: hypothetical protein VJR58_25005 [Vineibacter sp.]|nr:hypothetical protein [Vineibacter sp.]